MSACIVDVRERGAPCQAGFTLIEVVIVMAMVAIMLGLAAPSFVKYQRNSELQATANAFVSSLAAARAEAMKRNRSAYVLPASNNSWTTGWVVFVDMNANGAYDSADVLIAQEAAIPALIEAKAVDGVNQFADSAGNRYVRFNGSGFPKQQNDAGFSAGALDFSYSTTDSRRILLSPAGRMRVCKPDPTTCSASVL